MDTTGSRDDHLKQHWAEQEPVVAERARLASDLHDTAGQACVAIGLFARMLAEACADDSERAALARRIAEMADAGRSEIDEAIRGLSFAPATRRGLVPAIWTLANDIAADTRIDVDVDIRGPVRRMDEAIERALFRITHQSIANAWRHARCTSVQVAVDFDFDEVRLRVTDDGIGVDLTRLAPGLGMEGMVRCVAEVGGSVHVSPAPGGGTLVDARIPGRP